jgi:hypothetical protein
MEKLRRALTNSKTLLHWYIITHQKPSMRKVELDPGKNGMPEVGIPSDYGRSDHRCYKISDRDRQISRRRGRCKPIAISKNVRQDSSVDSSRICLSSMSILSFDRRFSRSRFPMISSDLCLILIIGSLSALLLKLFIAATHSLNPASGGRRIRGAPPARARVSYGTFELTGKSARYYREQCVR